MAFVFLIFAGQPRKFSPALKIFFAKGRSVECEIIEIIIILYNLVQIVRLVYYTVGLLYGSCSYFVTQNVFDNTYVVPWTVELRSN